MMQAQDRTSGERGRQSALTLKEQMEELVVLLGETTSRHPPSSHPPFLDDLSAPWVGGNALQPVLLETGSLWRCVLRVVSLRPSPAGCLSEPQFPHLCKEAGDLLTCRLCPCQASPESEESPGGGQRGGIRQDQKVASVPSLSSGKRARTAIDLSRKDLSNVLCPSHRLCRAGPSPFWEPRLRGREV